MSDVPGLRAKLAEQTARADRNAERAHEETAERQHWEAEHAALFRLFVAEGAAERIAKAFGGYDDLEWKRLDPRERAWLISKGQHVVDLARP